MSEVLFGKLRTESMNLISLGDASCPNADWGKFGKVTITEKIPDCIFKNSEFVQEIHPKLLFLHLRLMPVRRGVFALVTFNICLLHLIVMMHQIHGLNQIACFYRTQVSLVRSMGLVVSNSLSE